jgi:hypothetical protein
MVRMGKDPISHRHQLFPQSTTLAGLVAERLATTKARRRGSPVRQLENQLAFYCEPILYRPIIELTAFEIAECLHKVPQTSPEVAHQLYRWIRQAISAVVAHSRPNSAERHHKPPPAPSQGHFVLDPAKQETRFVSAEHKQSALEVYERARIREEGFRELCEGSGYAVIEGTEYDFRHCDLCSPDWQTGPIKSAAFIYDDVEKRTGDRILIENVVIRPLADDFAHPHDVDERIATLRLLRADNSSQVLKRELRFHKAASLLAPGAKQDINALAARVLDRFGL